MARWTGWALLAGGLMLAGCATPYEQCVYSAEQTTRQIERDLAEGYANLSRGYRIERIMMPRMVPSVCVGPGGVATTCMRMEQETEEIHHRINRDLERERIALMESQLARERPRAAAAAAQCQATYPAR